MPVRVAVMNDILLIYHKGGTRRDPKDSLDIVVYNGILQHFSGQACKPEVMCFGLLASMLKRLRVPGIAFQALYR